MSVFIGDGIVYALVLVLFLASGAILYRWGR